jgi:hypothetical protein
MLTERLKDLADKEKTMKIFCKKLARWVEIKKKLENNRGSMMEECENRNDDLDTINWFMRHDNQKLLGYLTRTTTRWADKYRLNPRETARKFTANTVKVLLQNAREALTNVQDRAALVRGQRKGVHPQEFQIKILAHKAASRNPEKARAMLAMREKLEELKRLTKISNGCQNSRMSSKFFALRGSIVHWFTESSDPSVQDFVHRKMLPVKPNLYWLSVQNIESILQATDCPTTPSLASYRAAVKLRHDILFSCPICFGNARDTPTTTTACGHCFHTACIKRWRNTANTCPLCRAAVE